MKVLRISPRDFYITFEASLTNIKHLSAILKKTLVAPETDEELAGADYLENILEPMCAEIIEECKDGS